MPIPTYKPEQLPELKQDLYDAVMTPNVRWYALIDDKPSSYLIRVFMCKENRMVEHTYDIAKLVGLNQIAQGNNYWISRRKGHPEVMYLLAKELGIHPSTMPNLIEL